MYQNQWKAAKSVIKVKYVTLNAFISSKERFKMYYVFTLRI